MRRHLVTATKTSPIKLRVLDGQRQPVRGVEALWYDTRRRRLIALGTSDMQGHIELHSVDRTGISSIRIKLSSPQGHLTQVHSLPDVPESVLEAVDLGEHLLTPSITVTGTVTRADDRPAVGVWVHSGDSKTLTDRQGRYAIRRIAPADSGVVTCYAGLRRQANVKHRPAKPGDTVEIPLVLR